MRGGKRILAAWLELFEAARGSARRSPGAIGAKPWPGKGRKLLGGVWTGGRHAGREAACGRRPLPRVPPRPARPALFHGPFRAAGGARSGRRPR